MITATELKVAHRHAADAWIATRAFPCTRSMRTVRTVEPSRRLNHGFYGWRLKWTEGCSRRAGGVLGGVSTEGVTHVLRLSQGPTSMEIPLSKNQMHSVREAIVSMIKTFSEKQEHDQRAGTGPKRWNCVDVCVEPDRVPESSHSSGSSHCSGIRMDIFCNPNACSNAFEARVLVTVRDESCGGLRVVTEVGLEEFKQSYKDAQASEGM